MSRIEVLEAEADRRRADFAETLRKVRRKLTPLGLADEALRQLDPGRQAVASAGRTLRRNPLPAIPVLLGLSWLALNARQPERAKPKRLGRKSRALIATQKKEDLNGH